MDKMPDEIIWNSDVDGKPRTKGGCANDTLYRRADLPKEVDVVALKRGFVAHCKEMDDGAKMEDEFTQGGFAAIDHLVALGVIKDKGV